MNLGPKIELKKKSAKGLFLTRLSAEVLPSTNPSDRVEQDRSEYGWATQFSKMEWPITLQGFRLGLDAFNGMGQSAL